MDPLDGLGIHHAEKHLVGLACSRTSFCFEEQ
jgi:hypothetical protein